MQTKQLHVRIPAEDMGALAALAMEFGMSATALAAMVLKAGVAAIRSNGDQAPFPLRFEVRSVSREKDLKPAKPSGRR